MKKGNEKKIIKIAALSAAGIAGFLLIRSLLVNTGNNNGYRPNGGGTNNGGSNNGGSNNSNWAGGLIDLISQLGAQIPTWIEAGKEAKNQNDQKLYQEYLQLQERLNYLNAHYNDTNADGSYVVDESEILAVIDRMHEIEKKIPYMF